MAKKRTKLSDQVRRAVDESGLSRYRICKLIEISQPTMSRFMSGQCGLTMKNLDKLADLLGLNITVGQPAAATAKRRK